MYSLDEITRSLNEERQRMTTAYFWLLLYRLQGNITDAASVSGVARPYLYKMFKEHGIEPESFRHGNIPTVPPHISDLVLLQGAPAPSKPIIIEVEHHPDPTEMLIKAGFEVQASKQLPHAILLAVKRKKNAVRVYKAA